MCCFVFVFFSLFLSCFRISLPTLIAEEQERQQLPEHAPPHRGWSVAGVLHTLEFLCALMKWSESAMLPSSLLQLQKPLTSLSASSSSSSSSTSSAHANAPSSSTSLASSSPSSASSPSLDELEQQLSEEEVKRPAPEPDESNFVYRATLVAQILHVVLESAIHAFPKVCSCPLGLEN